jgi:pimeloyl-ACP methyl ester carboxylesterase
MPELPGVTHRFVAVRGAQLHVAEAGSGPPVVALHGWPQHWWAWRDVMTALSPDHHVLAPDLRGFGWSEATPSGYEKEELASDLLELLDVLELDRVTFVGHDWGGVVGFLAALRRPERFARIVALNTAHPWPRTTAEGVRHAWAFAYQPLVASPVLGARVAASPAFLRLVFRLGTRRPEAVRDHVDCYAAPFREPARARAAQLVYRTFITREYAAWARGRYAGERLRVPLLWLHGVGDAVLRPHMIEDVSEHADDVRVEYVDDCGHFIADERPDVVVERLRAFMGRS